MLDKTVLQVIGRRIRSEWEAVPPVALPADIERLLRAMEAREVSTRGISTWEDPARGRDLPAAARVAN